MGVLLGCSSMRAGRSVQADERKLKAFDRRVSLQGASRETDRALFVIVSAASNTGLSHDPLSVNSSNAYTLSITMLLGRLLPIIVLWWMALTTRDAKNQSGFGIMLRR